MRRLDIVRSFLLIGAASTLLAAGPDGNRLAYLDGVDPYYPHRDFPKLTTPQWVGEEGVEAVVILAIDDMRDNAPSTRPSCGRSSTGSSRSTAGRRSAS